MWIARDKDGKLFLYKTKPNKYNSDNCWHVLMKDYEGLNSILDITDYCIFDNIRWTDKYPTKVHFFIMTKNILRIILFIIFLLFIMSVLYIITLI